LGALWVKGVAPFNTRLPVNFRGGAICREGPKKTFCEFWGLGSRAI